MATFQARIYAGNQTIGVAEVDSQYKWDYSTKKKAIGALHKAYKGCSQAIGGEVIRVKDGHYRTIYKI